MKSTLMPDAAGVHAAGGLVEERGRRETSEFVELKGVFISCPLSATTLNKVSRNVDRGMDAYIALLLRGQKPFLFNLAHFPDRRAGQWYDLEIPRELYRRQAISLLEGCCDSLLYLGKSEGTDAELERAKELKMRIFADVSEVPYASARFAETTENWLKNVNGCADPSARIAEVNAQLIRSIRRDVRLANRLDLPGGGPLGTD
jgi:hypothetical protein